ncbi:MAG: TonB-dependent receptor [Acidobacteria bacterium]|nr:TonB-dependent receptor [Acidobacteriota bacterium]
MRTKAFVLLIAWLTLSGVTYGQVITGTISGTVKDSSGAVLPGASVQVQNTDTGQGRTVTTDSRGYYTASNIRPGNYEITASVAGFQTEIKRGLIVNVGQASVIDFVLQVGAVTERVEVTAEAPLVETTNAVVSGLVTERQVEDLPLNSRSLIELAPLQAGIVMAPTGESSASKGMGAKFVVSGTRYNTNLFQVDGADINDLGGAAGSASQNLMGAETIKEFNIVINAYSAEYGKHSGGVFNAVTKSGTNVLHGSAFEFLRNDNLDANRWEDNRNNQPKAEFKRNQFGASLGGPIIKDRTFFFGSYEGLRERLGDNSTFTVPGAELRRGDIQNIDANGNFVFARHRDVVPQVQPYLDFYPIPSPNGIRRTGGTQEYYESFNRPTNEDFLAFRTDHKVSDNDSVFGRYTYSEADRVDSQNLSAISTNRSRNQSASIGYTRLFSSSVINQLLLSFARNNLADADAVIKEGAKAKLPSTYQFTSFPGSIGAFSVQSLTLSGFGNEGLRNYLNNTYQVKNDLFYTAGNHTWKFGINMQRNYLFTLRHFQGQGNYAFQNGGNACGSGTCQGVDNFLRGIARNFTALTRESQDVSYIRNWLTGLYIQDDWRLTPRLTLNLGLRYEFITVPSVQDGRVSTLRDFTKPGQSVANLVLGNPTFLNPSLKNWAPRIGIAWDPFGNGKTSIRTGTGIFHDQINAGAYAFSFLSSPPFYVVGNILGAVPTTGENPPTNPVFPVAYYTQQNLLAGQPNIEGFQYIPEQPTVYKWSFEIQQELPSNIGVTAGYAASRGVHLFRVVTSMNRREFEMRDGRIFIPSNAALSMPGFGRVRPRFSDVTSDYHALLVTVKKRMSRGLQFQTSYTLSKTVDDSSNWTGSSDWDNGSSGSRFFSIKDRSLAAFDVRQALSINGTYQLPGSNLTGAAGQVLGGWQLSSVVSLRGGNPFSPSPGAGNPGNFTNMEHYPDRVGPVKYDTRNPDGYFDPSGFILPRGYAAGESAALGGAYVGNAGRHILAGPGNATVDVVLQKEFRVTERVNLNFRSEFYNLFNRVNFGEPDTAIFTTNVIQANGSRGEYNPQAGKIDSTRGIPRQLQFGLRVEF